jgi:hypothetical protein
VDPASRLINWHDGYEFDDATANRGCRTSDFSDCRGPMTLEVSISGRNEHPGANNLHRMVETVSGISIRQSRGQGDDQIRKIK